MIRNNLAALMGERGLKITRVAKDTGISRNTITSIAQNDSEMMRLDTINTLCKYLGVTPCEFYEYEPLDINFAVYVNHINFEIVDEIKDAFISEDHLYINDVNVDVIMDVVKNSQTESFDLHCSLIEDRKFSLSDPGDFNYGIDLKIEFDNAAERKSFVYEVYNKINTSFHQDIYNNLINELTKVMKEWIIDSKKYSLNANATQNFIKGMNHFFVIRNLQSDVFKKF
ncbi:helix-turn-helix transcriptional regulator [Ureibacillus sp. Re31]|uniref:Helix-turn-helix transcriptional regulator n=1 Tax=Ureibacillus galli TaxID=2762222 RepID=A0ABR8X8B1_9BACL|nr:helix-turn-helix transcriptional regulator [Ureibacillus galli]MBD8025564.1 helix-turn-helix transcriptional regulator [Ureibacillus galli]